MAKRTTKTGSGKVRKVKTLVNNGSVSQTGIRRELAAQRKVFGEAGVKRAMKKWGLREQKAAKRGGKAVIKGKNG